MEILKFVLDQTGTAGLAALAIFFMQQNHQAYMKREEERAKMDREDKARLFDVIANNTASNVRLVVLIERLNATTHPYPADRHLSGDRGGD